MWFYALTTGPVQYAYEFGTPDSSTNPDRTARELAISRGGVICSGSETGIFDNDELRHAWLRSLGWRGRGRHLDREADYDRLADHVEAHLDMTAVRRLAGLAGLAAP